MAPRRRTEAFAKAQATFAKAMRLSQENCERFEIPLEKGTMPALYTRVPGDGPHPVVVFCNGLDSNKELLYWTRLPEALARRGISTLCVDQPGTGETLRLQNLPATVHSEQWASKAVDWLEARREIDPARIGMTKARTQYMKFGDRVRMEARLPSGAPLFGAIDQRVILCSQQG